MKQVKYLSDGNETYEIVCKNNSNLSNRYVDINSFKESTDVDYTKAFKRAISFIKELGGGTIFIPEGTFVCNVYMESNITLKGTGNTTILKAPNNCDSPVISFNGTDDLNFLYCGVENLIIDGNKSNQNKEIDGIRFSSNQSIKPTRDEVNWMFDSGHLVKNVSIINCSGYGLYLKSRGCRTFENVYVFDCDKDGIYICSWDCSFNDIIVGECKGNGISVLSDNNRFYNIKSWNNGLYNTEKSAGHGIYCKGNYNQFYGECQANLLNGIYVKESTGCIFSVSVDVSGSRAPLTIDSGVSAIKIDNTHYCNFKTFVQNRPDRNETYINSVISLINGSNYNIIDGTYRFVDNQKSDDTVDLQNTIRLIGTGN